MTDLSRRGLIAAPLLAAAATPALAESRTQEADAAKVAEARAKGEALLAQHKLPGLSIAVANRERVVFAAGFGKADLEAGVATTPDHLFRIGSTSKVVTTICAARLSERGVLDLDRPIGLVMPQLPEAHRATTLRQLFGHQGGVRHYLIKDFDRTAPGGTIDQRLYKTAADMLAIFINDALLSPPGERQNYSTFGYTLASAVMEAAAGKPFLELIQAEVAGPLGLSLQGDNVWAIVPGRARPYQAAQRYLGWEPTVGGQLVNAPAINAAYKWAGGGILAKASDLARMGAAVTRPGHLKAETLRMMFAPFDPRSGPPTGNNPRLGLGWRIGDPAASPLGPFFHHAGNIEGGRSALVVFPERGLAAALCTNIGDVPQDPIRPLFDIAGPFAA